MEKSAGMMKDVNGMMKQLGGKLNDKLLRGVQKKPPILFCFKAIN
jgi:hypothetical protein